MSDNTKMKIKSPSGLLDLPNQNGSQVIYDGQGLTIKNVEGFYHLYFNNQFDLEKMSYKGAPLAVCDMSDIESSFLAYTTLSFSEDIRKTLHEAIAPLAIEKGKSGMEKFVDEKLLDMVDDMFKKVLEVHEEFSANNFAVVLVSEGTDTDSEDIIVKTRTLNDAIAWCAVKTMNEVPYDTEVCSSFFRYEVYSLNALGEIDPYQRPDYKTHDFKL